MLDEVFNLLLPERRPVDFLVSRLGDDQMMLRPAIVLPSHQNAWPEGMVLALRGRVDRAARMLRVNGVVGLHDHHTRDFESLLTVVPLRGSNFARNPVDNLLASSWFDALPSMGGVTSAKLQEWSDYLEWKRKLIDAGVAGARYVSRTLEADGVWTFDVVLADTPKRAAIQKALKKRDLYALSLDYSEAAWELKWVETRRGSRCNLGEMSGSPTPAGALPDELREELPAAVLYSYRYLLSDADKTEFEKLCEERGVDDACRVMEERLPEQGFIATNAEGDRSLVKRQQGEIRELRENPGQAPFLAAYLFDIRQAQPPADDDISPNEWLRGGMNADQQAAVRMMLNTREISLIQGPPGSGKTTMIAEAIYQLTRRGKKVLLASQANLAVDNALERLSDVPSIRAIRLGGKADRTQPFAESNASASYWNTVAKACDEQHVGAWDAADARVRELRAQVDQLALLQGDLDLVLDAARIASERVAHGAASVEAARAALAAARQEHALMEDAQRFLHGVQDDTGLWSGSLPPWLCAPLHARLSAAWRLLDDVGLRSGQSLGMLDPLAAAAQSQDLFLFARHVSRIGAKLPGIRNEMGRLAQNTSGQLLTAEQERRIRWLTEEKQRLVDQFASGDGVPDLQARMNACSKELRALTTSGGLDRDWYASVFQANVDVFDQTATPALVAHRLALAADALAEVQALLVQAWAHARELLADARAQAVDVRELERQLANSERVLRDHHFDAESQERHLAAAMARLQLVAADRPVARDTAQQLCAEMLRGARDALAGCSEAVQRIDGVRADWAPILQEWIAGLKKSTSGVAAGYLEETFRQNCNVVAVTCNESRKTLNEAGHHSFDVAIIDEVSKATPPELLMAMSMARAIVLVGDHRQLPPVFKEGGSAQELLEEMEEQAAEGDEQERQEVALTAENIKRYEHLVSASLFKQHFEDAAPELKAFLLTQYRMHPQIMDVVNKFYENRLKCGLADPDGLLPGTPKRDVRLHGLALEGPGGAPYLSPDQHVLWVDSSQTPSGEQALESQSLSGGKSNHTEAALIVKMLRDIDKACHAQGHGKDGTAMKDVGVVSFYNLQVRIIRDLIGKVSRGEQAFKAIKVEVNTADNYQGKEKPIILVSLVRNPPHRLSAKANTARFERINVAFSRAQELLVIVGAADKFRNYPVNLPNLDRPGKTVKQVYGQILDEISLGGGFLHPMQVVDQGSYRQLVPEAGPPRAPKQRHPQIKRKHP
jgi:RecA/RadA recombinase